MTREDGFTLIETMLAAAIGTILIAGLTVAVSQIAGAASSVDARLQNQLAVAHAIERMTSDAASAWALSVSVGGNEVDYFSEDGSHNTYQWAYTYDSSSRHLMRAGEDLGVVDSFAAIAIPAAQLGSVDPLFSHSTIPSVTYGYDSMPGVTGGNGVVQITWRAAGVNRSELFASSTAPTAFTVVVTYTPSPAPATTTTPVPLSLSTP